MSLTPSKPVTVNRQRGRLFTVGCTLVAVLAGVIWTRDLGRADRLDAWWLRARFSLAEAVRPITSDPDIVLVDMDDKAVQQWPEPLILWGPHFARALNYLTRSGARVIALDWIQPVSADKYIPGHDEPLRQALSTATNVVMIKELSADGKHWIRPATDLLFCLPDSYRGTDSQLGYAAMAGRDSIVAANAPALPLDNGAQETSFSARIVERMHGCQSKLGGGVWALQGAGQKLAVPLRADGSVLINYRPGTGAVGHDRAFSHYSLYDVARATTSNRPDARFKNKIVIIGATYSGFNDEHYIPFLSDGRGARATPGVEIQANLVRTLLDGRPISEPSTMIIALLSFGLACMVSLVWLRFSWVGSALATLNLLAAWGLLSAWLFVAHQTALPLLLPVAAAVAAAVVIGSSRALGEERERRQVLGLWGRYQDPRLVDYLLAHPEARGGQGYEAQVTVLFADLKNFTKTVQHLEPAAALQVLNRYLALMTDVIRDEYGGIVDKYLGDGLLAQWGAPEAWGGPSADAAQHHAIKAVCACLELQRRAQELTDSMGEPGTTFSLRLTLHTGPVVVGWVGAEKIEFTIIGDTVNVCARLQETAKELNAEFVISQSTYNFAASYIETGKRTEVMIRGRDKPLQVYEVVGAVAASEMQPRAVASL